MERMASKYLQKWLESSDRKPLIIRGARQVGKTWLVRNLTQLTNKQLIEINLEKDPSYADLFVSNDVKQILLNLSTISNQKIDLNNSLLFIDEIQNSPKLLSKLRWFAEDLPQLPVIAAGSLLDFILSDHSFSIPVGRITYMYLEPLSFEEFLLANNKTSLYEYLKTYNFNFEIPVSIHQQFMMMLKEYILVGGMPAVVLNWIKEQSLNNIHQIQNDLLATYRDDFSKYKGRLATEKLDEVMMAIPKMLGQKFIFTRINPTLQSSSIKAVLELLEKARISYRVQGCAANGIPLAAEIKEKYFKEVFLDVGLCCAALGLNLNQINVNEINMINSGGLSEQLVAQILRTVDPFYIEPALYCWHREEHTSNAEIDYIMQHRNKVIPVEVKAGSTGHLKSLHLFVGLKKLLLAVRINSDLPYKTEIKIKDHSNKAWHYTLLSLPFYLTGQIHHLIDTVMS